MIIETKTNCRSSRKSAASAPMPSRSWRIPGAGDHHAGTRRDRPQGAGGGRRPFGAGVLLPVSGRHLHQRQRGNRPRHSRAARHPAGRSRQYRRVGRKGRVLFRYRRIFRVPPSKPKIDKLCRDGKRALWVGLNQVKSGEPLAKIGQASAPLRRKTAIRWSPTLPATASGGRCTRSRASCRRGRTLRKADDDGRAGVHRRAVPVARRDMGGRRRRCLDALCRSAGADRAVSSIPWLRPATDR
jgi:hypothetical protein